MKEKTGTFTAWIKNAALTILSLAVVLFVCGYLLSFVSWYGGMQWRDRIATDSIAEAKSRGVLVHELHFRATGFKDSLADFHAYIERGFRYGIHSSGETRVVTDSQFPYQFNFTRRPNEDISLAIRPADLQKFDTATDRRGYLRSPTINDTIELDVEMDEDEVNNGKILVWY